MSATNDKRVVKERFDWCRTGLWGVFIGRLCICVYLEADGGGAIKMFMFIE